MNDDELKKFMSQWGKETEKLQKQIKTNQSNFGGRNIMEQVSKKLVVGVVIGVVALILLLGSFDTVNPGERGVMITLGKTSNEVLGEGPHLKLPFISGIRKISVQVQKSVDTSEAATKDLQRVSATVALNWQIDQSTVTKMIQDFGSEESIEGRIIGPAVSEVLKAATAKMTAEEVLTKRMELKANIDEMLLKRLQAYGLIVKDISLTNLDFTREFNHAVEEKQIAEQQAKQASYVAEKATQDAKAAVETAKGEAESVLVNARAQAEGQKLLKQTLTKDVLALEYLKKWNGVLPQVMSGSGGGLMLNLNKIQDQGKE